jgi:hypothetical protein
MFIGALLAGVTTAAADASSPASGQLQKTQRRITWSGGPFVLSEPNYVTSGACVLGGSSDPICDHFALTVRLGDQALIEVQITTPNANPDDGIQPFDGDDYDLYVYSPSGGLVAKAENTRGNERVTFTHRARYTGRPYEVRVAPFSVMPGSRYTGTAKALSLGRR